MVTHEQVSENRGERGAHSFAILLVVETALEKEVSFFSCKLKKQFYLIFPKFEPRIAFFSTSLRSYISICKGQSLVKHPVLKIVSESWTLIRNQR